MSILRDFMRVTRQRRCPICERPDWCLVTRENPPSKAVCARVESPTRWGDAGFLHRLHDGPVERVECRPSEATPPARCSAEWMTMMSRYRAAVQLGLLAELAHTLGVSVAALHAMWIGWTGKAWAFPMSSPADDVVGIRIRARDGSAKWSEPGSTNALFLPTGHVAAKGDLLIVEGPTEAAAAIDLGFAVIGRPSCSAYVRGTIDYIRLLSIRRGSPVDAVIVANRDVRKVNRITGKPFWPGQRGAGVLFRALLSACRSVRVVMPPRGIKDLRDWYRAGLKRRELLSIIERARLYGHRRPQRLAILEAV